jgi:hypothetical protein
MSGKRRRGSHHRQLLGQPTLGYPIEVITVQVRQQHRVQRRQLVGLQCGLGQPFVVSP